MYTITFFSFKGGVGRSMALMNIALDLVSKGRKVALMDFDLEAPGLNTFGICDNHKLRGGVVDYVHDYLSTNISPEIQNYIIPCDSLSDTEGKLWLIPAGNNDDSYASKLADINWRDLYKNKQGYLLFEDLKAQILSEYGPDYLLIDSRTGHTDIGGICTRHLPNSVVFLFFPNEQNLLGLKKVSDLVDKENQNRPIGTQIVKHFVTSNVPDLDDENRILADRLIQFSKQLGYGESQLHTIHRYNSLSLLNQEIFTRTRPKTRLAEEYKKLAKAIIQENPEDKEGAASFLLALLKDKSVNDLSPTLVTERVEKITEKHGADPALMMLISQYKEQLGEYESALRYIDIAIGSGCNESSAYLRKAKLSYVSSNLEQTKDAIERFLLLPDVNFNELSLAINLMSRASPSSLIDVINSAAFKSLSPEDLGVIIEAHFFTDARKRDLIEEAILVLLNENRKNWNHEELGLIESWLPLINISKGNFKKALDLLSPTGSYKQLGRADMFNYAMAKWGLDGVPNATLFSHFLDKTRGSDFASENANFKQCLAVAYWVTGKQDAATEAAIYAQRQSRDVGSTSFSCWSYLYRSPKEFSADIMEMTAMFKGKEAYPKIFSKNNGDLF